MFGFQRFNQVASSLLGIIPNDLIPTKSLNGFVDPEKWVAIRSGNFTDPTIWEKNLFKVNRIPSVNAIVTIPRGVVLTINANATIKTIFCSENAFLFTDGTASVTVNNLNNYGSIIKLSGGVFKVISSCYSIGSFTNNGVFLDLNCNAYFKSILQLSSSIVRIQGNNKIILPFVYFDTLQILGSTSCFLGANTIINNIQITASLDVLFYEFIVDGVFTLNSSGTFKKTNSSNKILFKGSCTTDSSSAASLWQISDGTEIEFRGGFNLDANGSGFTTGNGNYRFTTSNQSLTGRVYTHPTLACNIIIESITLTASTSGMGIPITGYLNGIDVVSIFENKAVITYQSPTAPMLTGQLQCNNAANIFKYNRAGIQDVTGGTYRTIEFGGSGVKTLLGNVIVNVTAGGSQSTTGTASINLNGFTITTI